MNRTWLVVVLAGCTTTATCPPQALERPRRAIEYARRYDLETGAPTTSLERARVVGVVRDERWCLEHDDLGACERAYPFSKNTAVAARLTESCQMRSDARACMIVGITPGASSCAGRPHVLECVCEVGELAACIELAEARHDSALLNRSTSAALSNCEAGSIADCGVLRTRPFSIPAPMMLAANSLDCQLGQGHCLEAARLFLAAGDPIAARYHLEVGCQVFGQCDDLWEAYATHAFPELYPGRTADVRRQAMQASRPSPSP